MQRTLAIGVIVAAVSGLLLAAARGESHAEGGIRITLPPETGVFKPGPGSEVANGQCLPCHSVEYVTMQPPMPRAFWAASVKKMREKFGANIPEDQADQLVNYLVKNYGTELSSTTPASNVVAKVEEPLTADVMALRFGCTTCHNVDRKVVGPAFKDVVAKYQADPKAIDRIMQQIHDGGSGKWGSAVMPPFSQLPESDSRKLAEWVMRQGTAK